MSRPSVYSVEQVNKYIKDLICQDFMLGSICVLGEISNCKYSTSGHIYFTLKDDKSNIDCVMFASAARSLKFKLERGKSVIVSGRVDVYEASGRYQLYAQSIEDAGAGDLNAQYEALKARLEEMGMFAEEYKKPIPKYIRTLGVVTAETGAVIHDIMTTVARRNPTIQIILVPAQVQGEGAASTIIDGIHTLEKMGVDAMIVGRGGGSIEDLWCFNDEELAMAVFNCSVPIVSAVGHESDVTIIDYVADRRAATPTAAAEICAWLLDDTLKYVDDLARQMRRSVLDRVDRCRARADGLRGRIKAGSPQHKLETNRIKADAFAEKYYNSVTRRLDGYKNRLSAFSLVRLTELANTRVQVNKNKMAILAGRIDAASPMKKLASGYSLVTDSDNKIAKYDNVSIGDELTVHMLDGDVRASVTQKLKARR